MPIPDGIDDEKRAEIALAILFLGSFSDSYETRAWKGMDWDITGLLYKKGWISDPKNKSKPVALSEDGKKLADQFLEKHFSKA